MASKIPVQVVAKGTAGQLIDARTFKPVDVVLWVKGVHHQPVPITQETATELGL